MAVGQGAGEHPGQPAAAVDGDVHRQVGRAQGGGGADEVVDRIALGDHPGRPGVGHAGRAVGLEDGGGGGQARAGSLGASAPSGEEVGLDEAGQDADVGRRRSGGRAGPGRRPPRPPTHGPRRRLGGRGSGSGATMSAAHQSRPSPPGWPGGGCRWRRAAPPGRVRRRPARARPAAGAGRWCWASGRVMSGKTTTTRSPGPTRSPSAGPDQRRPQGLADRPASSASGGRLAGPDHHGVVGHLDVQAVDGRRPGSAARGRPPPPDRRRRRPTRASAEHGGGHPVRRARRPA